MQCYRGGCLQLQLTGCVCWPDLRRLWFERLQPLRLAKKLSCTQLNQYMNLQTLIGAARCVLLLGSYAPLLSAPDIMLSLQSNIML